MLLCIQSLVEGILHSAKVRDANLYGHLNLVTITRITTHGRFKDFTISMATEVLPEPELPAMPMMLKSAHGGEYLTCVADEYTGEIDSMIT